MTKKKTNKKQRNIILAIISAAILIPIAWYLISPAFIVVDANDVSPLDVQTIQHLNEQQQENLKKEMMDMQPGDRGNDLMPVAPQVLKTGDFKPKAHEVEGNVKLIEAGDETILRFENFHTINGPELHIYLATDPSAEEHIDLGIIKATRGNVNYEITEDIDFEKYSHVLVWCQPFRVLFSYAQLS